MSQVNKAIQHMYVTDVCLNVNKITVRLWDKFYSLMVLILIIAVDYLPYYWINTSI